MPQGFKHYNPAPHARDTESRRRDARCHASTGSVRVTPARCPLQALRVVVAEGIQRRTVDRRAYQPAKDGVEDGRNGIGVEQALLCGLQIGISYRGSSLRLRGIEQPIEFGIGKP